MIKIQKYKGYFRYSIFLYKYEHVLIKWLSNGNTNIHSHNGKSCTMNILKGPLTEYRYNHHTKETNILKPWNSYYIDDTLGCHKIVNPSPTTKWSYHIYYLP
jgi:hypothetical protein